MDDLNPMLMAPDQRRRYNAMLMAQQYDRTTPQDTTVVERAGLLPIGTYANGMTGLAFPGFLADPVKGFINEATNPVPYLNRSEDEKRQAVETGFDVAGAAMVGGLAAPKPSGIVGSAGGRLSESGAAAGAALNALDNPPAGIRAYHGSPHDFDKFDLSKAGTGVGFKSYGHGVNLTRTEDVGNIYKHALADPDGGPLRLNANPDGHIYEVNVNVSPTELMDWNKRIADQPYVSERVPPQYHDMTGGDYHDILEADLKAKAKEDFKAGRMSFFSQPDYKKQIADDLLARGIKGVSYVDSDPKVSLGSGASNLTVFDPELIDILRKYGLSGFTAGGAALNEMMSGAQEAPRRSWSNAMLPGDA